MSTADLILMADRIHTLAGDGLPTAIAVADGVITALGDRSGARDWRGPCTEVIDLGDATITPGLVDGHFHPVMGIGLTRGVDLSGVRTINDLECALRGVAVEPGGWLEGWGLDPNVFAGAPITHEPLVAAVGPDIPVFLLLFDAHSALVSPRALELAGITGPRTFTSGASVVCDAARRPTGHLLEIEAFDLVRVLLPDDGPADRRARLAALLRRMAACGLTAANAMDFEADSLDLFGALEDDGDLPVRWRCAPFVMPGAGRDGLDDVIARQHLAGRRWEVRGAKFMIDGTIDGGTAWLDEPDSHGESTACLWPDPAGYAAAARFLARHDIPIVTHAIGDAGVRYVLDTYAGLARTTVPHRIEHLETMPTELIDQLAALDVTASMQPTHCTGYVRADHTDNWSTRLGKRRADRAFRARDLRDRGARLVLGSDWPIAPFDPREIMAAARLRRPAGSRDVEPVLPEQALTARMALEGYTSEAAAAEGLSDVTGRLIPGHAADLTVFSRDPLTTPADELSEIDFPMTVVGGRIAHRS
ncbi:amidohydrolase [Actinoplanes couchii]|uniref:Amidohydrolase n=1 Tax=Actinoplanes couchii TaxID=403638 RepID=A0ABQ3X7E3_9ACTN|nr:amidohydrolase family protein [Actinoplanes couchii]MDR6322261.1 putative amidohydrolase YtcJ [Actinoplanes couchii]GID54421.1 amidohydrolase [Actinoplanes couchii]